MGVVAKRVLFVLACIWVGASCAKDPTADFPLKPGIYTSSVKDGILCVEIENVNSCYIYFEGYKDYPGHEAYHGSFNYNGGGVGSIFSIKGYASKPYDENASPSDLYYHWQYIYTFTGSAGAIMTEDSFQYFVDTQRPWDDDKTINIVFTKR